MLLRFAVSNFRSIRDEQELSMVAAQAIKDDPAALIETPALRKDKVLPAALIYGANASGKSNVVAALRFMQRMVLSSHRLLSIDETIPIQRSPFRLDRRWLEKEGRFDVTFIHFGVRYEYGFSVLDHHFESEWLYAWPLGSSQKLFERKGQVFSFGRSLKGANQVIGKLTRPNSLFVSAATQNNHEALRFVFKFFSSLHFEEEVSPSPTQTARLLGKMGIDQRAIKLLNSLNTGIKELQIMEEIGDDDCVFYIPKRNKIPGSSEPQKPLVAQLGRSNFDGEIEFFDLQDESTGTIRLLSFLGPVFKALDAGTVVIVDEIDASLHTLACEQITALFQSPKTNPKGAQLIATTHDTNLLKSEMLRRDQVWFTEKDDEGATHLYPLTDIYTRKGDNIEKGYLQGRFGAVPFAGSVDDFIKMD